MDLVHRITIPIPMEVTTTRMTTVPRTMTTGPVVDTQVQVAPRDTARAHRKSKIGSYRCCLVSCCPNHF